MLYKIIYILVIISPIFSQSFFNRIMPEELYYNDAKSMSMGKTNISIGSNSGSIISNPALLSNNEDGIHLDMNLDFNSISERRSIVFRDDWEETLGETDYAFNQNNYFGNRFGLTYSASLRKVKITGSIAQNPFLSLNYNYEEEVRGSANLSDGVIGIPDPIVGYHSYSNSGTLDVQSAGISFSFKTDKRKDYSIGFGVNNILDTKLTDEIKLTVIDDSYGLENLSLMDDVKNTYSLGAEERFHTLGAQIPITNELVLTLSYEEDLFLGSRSYNQWDWSYITGLPLLFSYIEEELMYLPIGFVYQKPEKRNLGFIYYPESNVNMTLVFEIANRYWDVNVFPGFTANEINEYKLGFEYDSYNSYPIRAGLVYSESIFDAIEPTAILTLGTGGKVGKVEFDLAMNYSTTKYKYFDIFPLEDIYNLSCDDIGCDSVTDNKLSFLTTFKIGF
tara:strand:+ start:2040 stop:3383 length:1344 start_codon:yes stop_codon:yes gene_type:complete